MSAPTDTIEQDVLDIVAVVLGTGAPPPLDPAGRALALAAMNALGYSATYMGEQLRLPPRNVASLASALNVPLDRGRKFVDAQAVDFVLQGIPMRLRGNDMDAALIRLAQRGTTVAECARLLHCQRPTIRRHATALGITLDEHTKQCWWNDYYDLVRAAGTEK